MVIGPAGSNVVEGSFIGTTSDGMAPAGNEHGGLLIDNSPGNRVGGTTVAARNVLAGNVASNVRVYESGSLGNLIKGNHIGVDRLGQAAVSRVPLMTHGIEIGARRTPPSAARRARTATSSPGTSAPGSTPPTPTERQSRGTTSAPAPMELPPSQTGTMESSSPAPRV